MCEERREMIQWLVEKIRRHCECLQRSGKVVQVLVMLCYIKNLQRMKIGRELVVIIRAITGEVGERDGYGVPLNLFTEGATHSEVGERRGKIDGRVEFFSEMN